MMYTTTLLLNILALGSSVLSSTLPIAARNVCNADNCLRALNATQRAAAATSFCQSYLSMHVVTSTISTVFPLVTATSTSVLHSTDVTTETDLFSTTITTSITTKPPALDLYRRVAVAADPAATFISYCGTSSSRLSSACNCFQPAPSTTYVTITAPTSTTTAITSTTTTEASTVTTSTTNIAVATSLAIAPPDCMTGGLYETGYGAILELSCLTDFPGYSASSQATADMPSCMNACGLAFSTVFGSCVGVSYDYATSMCTFKYGISVSAKVASLTVHSARIMSPVYAPCRDGTTHWGDIFTPSGAAGDSYTMFCGYNHPDGDQGFDCGAGVKNVDECTQLCANNNAIAGNPNCVAAVFAPQFAPDRNCCLKSFYQPSDMIPIPSFYCDTARKNVAM